MTATPNTSASPPWSFLNWSDGATTNPRSVTVSQVNQSLTANFITYTVTATAAVSTCYQRPWKPHSCHVTAEVRDHNSTLIGGPLTVTGYSTSDTTAVAYYRNPTTGRLEVTHYAGTPWKPGNVIITAFYTRNGVVYRNNDVTLTLLPPP